MKVSESLLHGFNMNWLKVWIELGHDAWRVSQVRSNNNIWENNCANSSLVRVLNRCLSIYVLWVLFNESSIVCWCGNWIIIFYVKFLDHLLNILGLVNNNRLLFLIPLDTHPYIAISFGNSNFEMLTKIGNHFVKDFFLRWCLKTIINKNDNEKSWLF